MPADAPSATIPVAHEIELRFIEWGRPTLIAREYAIRDRGTIYRHAHAAGLFAIRLRNFMCLYENTIEQAQQTKISSHTIMVATQGLERAMSKLPGFQPERKTTVTRLPSPQALSGSRRNNRSAGRLATVCPGQRI